MIAEFNRVLGVLTDRLWEAGCRPVVLKVAMHPHALSSVYEENPAKPVDTIYAYWLGRKVPVALDENLEVGRMRFTLETEVLACRK